ncbi:hypothetical protein G5I_11140 [Acromyrmex echinatior]|uniref:Uncharacterized protein n=1 Tax=Acromyrmex echinatior TaxID=103372 RepID=F4WYS6_ACREC|nr:hypothetical protein G5I_11140 [Acromyrmex echinatior]
MSSTLVIADREHGKKQRPERQTRREKERKDDGQTEMKAVVYDFGSEPRTFQRSLSDLTRFSETHAEDFFYSWVRSSLGSGDGATLVTGQESSKDPIRKNLIKGYEKSLSCSENYVYPRHLVIHSESKIPRTASSMQSSRFGFFRAGYVATGIYAASTAKRVASQKSPCKNEERSKEEDEEENGERYCLKTVKSGSTLSPVQSAKRLSLFSFALFVF